MDFPKWWENESICPCKNGRLEKPYFLCTIAQTMLFSQKGNQWMLRELRNETKTSEALRKILYSLSSMGWCLWLANMCNCLWGKMYLQQYYVSERATTSIMNWKPLFLLGSLTSRFPPEQLRNKENPFKWLFLNLPQVI